MHTCIHAYMHTAADYKGRRVEGGAAADCSGTASLLVYEMASGRYARMHVCLSYHCALPA